MSYYQLNWLKSEIKNSTEVTLNHSSKVIGDSNDETNSPHRENKFTSKVILLWKTKSQNE